MPHILELPSEVLGTIIGLCATADVKRFCETCRSMRDSWVPELYREIDLSSHNADIEYEPFGVPTVLVPPHFVSREVTDLDKKVFQKQRMFIETLNEVPAYGEHVRKLQWTILTDYDQSDESEESGLLDGESDEEESVFVPEDEPLWQTFRSFTKIANIDICWIREWREVTLPGPLFRSATAIRLVGRMTLEFVGCILGDSSYPNPSAQRLQTLELDNLMQWADIEPPLPKFSHLRALAEYFEQHKSTLSVVDNTRSMVGALDPIVGCCSSLTSLRIGTVGEYEEYSEDPRDDRLYSSWARFLASIRPTLQYFFFEQGPNRNDMAGTKGYCRGRPSSEHRPMDRLFRNWILPVLLEAPWLLMRRMEIRGVGRNTKRFYRDRPPTKEELAEADTKYDVVYHPHDSLNYEIFRTRIAFPSAAKEKLRLLVGDNAELIIEEEASQDYDRLRSDDTGIPPVDE